MNEQLPLDFGNLKLVRVGHEELDENRKRWLIEGIWLNSGTGMLAGMPKSGKTWLVIDMAISVASGTPFLGKFPTQQGPVVIYSPEGPKEELEERIRQVAATRGLNEKELPLHRINAEQLFLNSTLDQQDIRLMAEKVQPALSVFDPLIECFDGNENHNEEVNRMTRFINKLARETSMAVMITHHMQKSGEQMRGAGTLRAFGDTNLVVEKTKLGQMILKTEQRHATPADPVTLDLVTVDGNTCYRVIESEDEEKRETLNDRILAFLKTQKHPLSLRKIRDVVKGDSHKYKDIFNQLKFFGEIRLTDAGWEYVREGERKTKAKEPPETAQDAAQGPAPESPSAEDAQGAPYHYGRAALNALDPEVTETKQETAAPEEPHKGPETADTAPETETQGTPPPGPPSAQDPE